MREDAPVTCHKLEPEKVESIANFEAVKERIVVINPYSDTMRTTMEIYEMLCEKLISRGYYVFTNVVGD